uniref:Hedgehog acyltransferase n=1 Tax=Cynoglossus semilaevis TaxID=244447 RepID=A0A3P8ULD8_CYNSE
MTSKSKTQLAKLPQTEILIYWLLSFGSHLYSFYHLHRFSKEHEVRLNREYQLEPGLVKGYKRDPSEFEWSFWTEWGKKSLLWTFTGHLILSRLLTLRVPTLSVYDFLAACSVLGVKGVGVLLTHMLLSFSVAQLRKPVLSWLCILLLLSTLYIQPLQDVQRSWYDTEGEYYLLLFSVAVCGLRFISFSLELCWSPAGPGSSSSSSSRRRGLQLCWLFSYTFYHPFFYNGPIITYKDYKEQSGRQTSALHYLLLRSGRIILWWCTAEYMIHVMYMHCIQSNETYLEILPPWALGGLALAVVQFFYVKYLVLFGLPSMLATVDGLVPPNLPTCVSIMHTFTGMWRYIYVPLGGSRHGPLYKILSTGLAFGFVCFWHGGSDYLQYWAVMNWVGVLVENGLRSLLTSSVVQYFVVTMKRRAVAFLCAFSTAMLILSNLVFLGGIHVGRIFWKRVFIQGWSTVAPPMLAFLYCFAQIGLEWTSHPA